MSAAAHGGAAPPPPPSAERIVWEERISAALEMGEPDERYQRCRAILGEIPLGADRDALTQRVALALGLRPGSFDPPSPVPGLPRSAPPAAAEPVTGELVRAPAAAVVAAPPTHGPGSDLERFWKLGRWLAMSEGDLTQEGQARGAMRYFYAAELGVSPIAARLVHIFPDGRMMLGAELLRALAQRVGLTIRRRDEPDGAACTAILLDAETGAIIGESTYTLEQARRAGLLDRRPAWQKNPEDMLWARAATRVLRDYAPHVALQMEGLPTSGAAAREPLDFHGESDPDPAAEEGGYTPDDDIPF